MRHAITPRTLLDAHGPKQVSESKQYDLTTHRKFFHASQGQRLHSLICNFHILIPLKNNKIVQKLHGSEWRRWLWESWKNLLCVVRSYCLLSETSLGPCASNKVRRVITCCTNRFLLTQKWKHSEFCILIPLQESFTSEKQQNSVKIACKWVKTLAFRVVKNFSVRP